MDPGRRFVEAFYRRRAGVRATGFFSQGDRTNKRLKRLRDSGLKRCRPRARSARSCTWGHGISGRDLGPGRDPVDVSEAEGRVRGEHF